MEITFESLNEHIPYYLTQGQKEGLIKALKAFIDDKVTKSYYLNRYLTELLQGDAWTKLKIRNFDTGETGSILGIILSNSCDIASENIRDFPVNITFAPLIPLSKYAELLKRNKLHTMAIDQKIRAIKRQGITSMFFLPAGGGLYESGCALKEDHIALFDDIYTMPLTVFESEKEKSKVLTLSDFGFYLFIFKLSIHFCRFQENLQRS